MQPISDSDIKIEGALCPICGREEVYRWKLGYASGVQCAPCLRQLDERDLQFKPQENV
jgi:hypothetical protein